MPILISKICLPFALLGYRFNFSNVWQTRPKQNLDTSCLSLAATDLSTFSLVYPWSYFLIKGGTLLCWPHLQVFGISSQSVYAIPTNYFQMLETLLYCLPALISVLRLFGVLCNVFLLACCHKSMQCHRFESTKIMFFQKSAKEGRGRKQ